MRIVVTGASGALGRAFVDSSLKCGHRLAASICSQGGDDRAGIIPIARGDLSDADFAARAIGDAAQKLGGADAFVHLAGAFAWEPTLTSSVDFWRSMMKANVETALCSIQAIIPHLSKDGAIVCVGAAAAQSAEAGMAAYATAKSGIARLVESLAIELKPKRIRVNGVLPRVMDTGRNRQDMPNADWSEWTSTSAIADSILFLCGIESRAINGAMIPVTSEY